VRPPLPLRRATFQQARSAEQARRRRRRRRRWMTKPLPPNTQTMLFCALIPQKTIR